MEKRSCNYLTGYSHLLFLIKSKELDMQTILGSGGAIGIELAKALTKYTNEIRLVSRHPEKVNSRDELFAGDLLNKEELNKAVAGSSIVYVTVGFPYNLKVWKENLGVHNYFLKR